MTIGEKIHDLRLRNNMTMEDLARQIGVQRSAINKYEKGLVVNLKRSTIASLCRVFGVLFVTHPNTRITIYRIAV